MFLNLMGGAFTLLDSHCHLQDIDDVDVFIRESRAAGITKFLTCGTSPQDWDDVCALGKKYDCVFCAYGVHPWYADNLSGDWETVLREHLRQDPQASVGEIGLDKAVKTPSMEKQISVFTRQLDIADEFGRFVSIHCVRAWGILLDILKSRAPVGGIYSNLNCGVGVEGVLKGKGVVHGYSGSLETAKILIELGYCISFNSAMRNSQNPRIANIIKNIPPEKILFESE